MKNGRLIKRSMRIDGKKTSVGMEAAFWDEAEKIASWRGETLPKFFAGILHGKPEDCSLVSAIRVAILEARAE